MKTGRTGTGCPWSYSALVALRAYTHYLVSTRLGPWDAYLCVASTPLLSKSETCKMADSAGFEPAIGIAPLSANSRLH
jgi:hypothetical protein